MDLLAFLAVVVAPLLIMAALTVDFIRRGGAAADGCDDGDSDDY